MGDGNRPQIGWIDLLRVMACFLVVFSHCCDPFVAQFENDRASFLTGVFSGSLVRACVPLFVMMTAVLLLPVKEGMTAFYRKRVGRIAVPAVFWSIVLPLLFFGYLGYVSPDTANPAIAGDHGWSGTVGKMYTFIFNFNYDTTPLWYVYMLVGLYLLMPILSAWLERASKRDLKTFLCVWGVTLLLPYLKMAAPLLGYTGNYGNMGLWGECDWNDYGMLYYFSGFVGYMVLGYYLMKYPLRWSRRRTLLVAVPTFVVGYLITAFGYLLTQKYFPGNYAYLEIVWYFAGINVFMMTFAVFAVVRAFDPKPRRWLSKLASLTFGIYLCHFVFVVAAYDLFDCRLPYIVRIVCMTCTAFAVSAALTWLMRRIPLTRRLVA